MRVKQLPLKQNLALRLRGINFAFSQKKRAKVLLFCETTKFF